jgi:hypothetical protein
MANTPLQNSGLPGRAILGFMAGASVMRAAAYRQVGGYCPHLFLGGEEELMALDLAALGWRMLYHDALVVHHLPSSARDAKARRALLTRNAIWVACLRLPWRELLRRILTIDGLEEARMRTVWRTLVGLPWAFKGRKVIPKDVERMRRCVQAAARLQLRAGTPSQASQ